MRKFSKILMGISAFAICAVLSTGTVKAASVSATGDKDTAAVGDSYTVSVTIDGAEGAAVAPDVSVNYDVNRLEFVSCSGEYGGGGGGFITLNSTSADITFNILSGGQANVDVSAIFEDSPEPQIVTATIMVEGEDTAAVDDRAREDMGTGIEAGSIATLDGKLVSAVFADEFMPVGFYKTTVTYEEQLVEAAQFDMGGIVLLYVTDADGNNGNFDIYNQATGELSDFLQISGIENRFIIALKAGEEVSVPENFTKATLQWNAQTLEAYAYTGPAVDSGSVNIGDFFLIYAISSEGNTGFYMYDQNEGTYQRYVEGLHGNAGAPSDNIISQITSSSSDEEGGVNVLLIIVIACAVLLLALIITVIIMAVKLHEFNSYDYIDEDEEVEDDYLDRLAANSNNRSENIQEHRPEPSHEEEIEDDVKVAKERGESVQPSEPKNEDSDIPEEFVVRRKSAKVSEQELKHQAEYEQDQISEDNSSNIDDDADMFSPRERGRGYSEDGEKLTRAEKKALKAEEKAKKKAEKRMRKEYGEYGPVDWESWQSGVEGGARTAAAHMSRDVDVDEEAVRRPAPQPARRMPEPEYEEETARRSAPNPQPVKRAPEPEYEDDAAERQAQGLPPKGNPRDMMRGIPANDNKAPVQAKPVQQFDFDDDFEFEFLDLDEDD